MVKCPKCGAAAEDDTASFCAECGAQLVAVESGGLVAAEDESGLHHPRAGVKTPPIELAINDNHFYMEMYACVLEFRLLNRSGANIEDVSFLVSSKLLGITHESRFPVIRLKEHRDGHDRIAIVPDLAGEHVVDITLRYRIGGELHVWTAQPFLKVWARNENPSTIIFDASMIAGGSIGYGHKISDQVSRDVAAGQIRDVNDLINRVYPAQWSRVSLLRRHAGGREAGTRTCPTCGEENRMGHAYCGSCGADIAQYTKRIQEAIVDPEPTKLDLGSGLAMDLVLIPAGGFVMGSNNGDRDEKPPHRIRISQPFYLGKYEVTQAQWQAVMGDNPSHFRGDDRPVENVSWEDCREFCQRLSDHSGRVIRLPSEAEWEYSCRAGTTTPYSFVESTGRLGDHAWYHKHSGQKTHAVGMKQPNPWGLYDMHGNVWEWCGDWYGEAYYADSPGTDPTGPGSGQCRVLRGGSWSIDAHNCRCANRGRNWPDGRLSSSGFRVVAGSSPSSLFPGSRGGAPGRR